MPARRIVELAARLVVQEGIVVPAVPQARHHIGKLFRALVALGMCEVVVPVEIECFVLAGRGDQVPPCPAAGDVIERCELAGDMVGLVEAGRGRTDEPDALRHRRQRRQQRDRLELGLVAMGRSAQEGHIVPACAHAVGQEDQIELGGLGSARQCNVVLEVDARVGLGIGMSPGGNMVSAWVQERAKAQLVSASCHGQSPDRQFRKCGLPSGAASRRSGGRRLPRAPCAATGCG